MSEWIPPLIHWQRDALNGHYPAAGFYACAIAAENFLVGHGDRSVVQKSWALGYTRSPGYASTTTHRFRFRSRYGAAFLRTTLVIRRTPLGGGATPVPYVDVIATIVVNSATPAWFVATGLAPTSPQKLDWQFCGSGTQPISVSSASLIEWEAR